MATTVMDDYVAAMSEFQACASEISVRLTRMRDAYGRILEHDAKIRKQLEDTTAAAKTIYESVKTQALETLSPQFQ